MIRIVPLILSAFLLLLPQESRRRPIYPAAGVTWTLVQHPSNYTCSWSTGLTTTTCTVATTATTAGNLLIIMGAVFVTHSGVPTSPTYTSANGDTFTHCPNSHADIAGTVTRQTIDCYYVLSAAGAATSLNMIINPHTHAGDMSVEVFEVHRSTGTAVFDTDNNTTNASCTSCNGPALTLTGTDFVAVSGSFEDVPTAINSPYTNPTDLDNHAVFGGFGGALNQSSYTTSIFTQTSAGKVALASTAFK